MKRYVIALLSIASLLLASCRIEKPFEEVNGPGGAIAARALLPAYSKISYEETPSGGLKGSWEVGDVIFGFTADGSAVEFKVSAVDAKSGEAVLTLVSGPSSFSEGDKIYAIYCPGYGKTNLEGQSLALDFSSQTLSSLPALMLSEATVQPGPSIAFTFRNAVSVVGIDAPDIEALNASRSLKKVVVSGHNIVSSGKVSVKDGSLVFEGDAPSKFITRELDLPVRSIDGKLSVEDVIYVAVPPRGVAGKAESAISKVTLFDSQGQIYNYSLASERSVEASKYYRVYGKSFPKMTLPYNSDVSAGGVWWADRNLGATSISNGSLARGDLYRWGDYELLYTEKSYDPLSITFKSEYSSKGFAAVAGQNYYNGSTYDKYNATDGKTVLDPVDDIVQLTYPGSGWRMPTIEEFRALNADIARGTLTASAGTSNSYFNISDSEGDVLAMVRITHSGEGKALSSAGAGRIWTSTVVSDEADANRFLKAYYIRVNSNATMTVEGKTYYRHSGYAVRPVLPDASLPGGSGGGKDEASLPNVNAGKSITVGTEWSDISIDYSNLKASNHPRLFLRDSDIKAICTQVEGGVNPNLTKLHNSLLKAAKPLVHTVPDLTYNISEGGRLLQTSRKALYRIATSAYAYRITGEDRYLEMADRTIRTVCNFPDWHPAHFLDVAEMAQAVAIGYDWLYNDLPQATLALAREKLRTYALEQAEATNIYNRTGNWNQVCNGGLVSAALAIYEDCPELSDRVLRKALASNAAEIKQIYAPDGACSEGPGYWEYGTTYQGILNLACETALGTDFELPSIEGFDKAGTYYMFIRGNSGLRFNYSDSGEKNEASLGLWYIAYKYHDGSYLYQDIHHLDDGFFEDEDYAFLALTCCYKLGNVAVTPPSGNLYRGSSLSGTQVLMCRTGWETDDLYLALKGGHANISHAHMDVGEVVFDAYGTRWIKDFTYSTNYETAEAILRNSGIDQNELGNRGSDSPRWKFFQYHNLRHSTISINKQTHHPYGTGALSAISESGRMGGYVDLSDCLWSQVQTGNRTAVIRDGSYLEITDKLTALSSTDAVVRWVCCTSTTPEVLSDGSGIELTDPNGVKMKIETDAPGAVFKIWSSDPASSEDYTSPFTETAEACQKKLDGYLCGYEYTVTKGASSTVVTTLKKQ